MPIWLSALALALIASFLCFDARPGINWPLWTMLAAAGLYYYTTVARPAAQRDVALPLALAVILSLGAAITAEGGVQFLIVVGCIVLLSVALRIAAGASVERIGAGFIATSPLVGAVETLQETWRRTGDAARQGEVSASLPVLRGVLIAAPIVVVLWWLFAQADPHMSSWGSAIANALEDLTFVPRLLFGFGIGVLVLGAYGLVLRGRDEPPPPTGAPLGFHLPVTERLIVLGAVAGLLALFLALQLPSLFGNPAGMSGTGVTYAEWAHRGFGELTTAATLVTVLIITLETHAARGVEMRERATRLLALTLVALTTLVVLSAFRRIALYELAYGYTVSRLWAQAFMLGVALALALLAVEIHRRLDARRLARRTGTIAALMLATLIYWNHEAFIVRRNVARFAGTPKLDVSYLGGTLGDDAIPALFAARELVSLDQAAQLTNCLIWRSQRAAHAPPLAWYEFNLRRQAALALLNSVKGGPEVDATHCLVRSD